MAQTWRRGEEQGYKLHSYKGLSFQPISSVINRGCLTSRHTILFIDNFDANEMVPLINLS